jgi:amino acid adenylation domain-containing protein
MKHANVERAVHNAGSITGLLHCFFEEQARRRPDHPAVECNGETLTYAQLNERADGIARHLRAEGVGSETLVALFISKSCELFAAMLGILKSGAGYVPIDPKFPTGRIQAIVEDAGIKLILTDETLAPTAAELSTVKQIVLGVDWTESPPECGSVVSTPRDICYVIYTSGSMGRPKGVVVEHRQAANFVQSLRTVYKIDEDDRVYQGFSLAFDASIEEIWAAFSVGGTLVIPSEEIAHAPLDTADFINRERISFFSTVPSFLALMTPNPMSLRLLVLGGEACPPQLVTEWMRPGLRILNTYGPTEATVVATALECALDQPVSIGSALPGYLTHVLNDELKPVTIGEIGELYIGGGGVARGYLNRPDLTAERFLTIPGLEASGRIYRTYDLVRLLHGGQMQFVGRCDAQVKIRGFRVELSEIESVLSEYVGVRQAAVKTVEIDGIPEIAAFVVLEPEVGELNRQGLIDNLRHRVPEYMIPKFLDFVGQLPTMTSGKIDRKALPAPTNLLREPSAKIAAPETGLQCAITEICQKILHIQSISMDDDFFVDLHGHSLTAARVASEIRVATKSLDISVRDFYKYRTIRNLSAAMEERKEAASPKQSANEAESQDSGSAASFPPLPRLRWLCLLLQTLGLLAFYGVVGLPLCCAVLLVLQVLDGSLPWEVAARIATFGGFAVWPSWLLLSIALKWIVIGRFKPGRYPVWGFYYFRWWLVTRFQALSWSEMFVDTPLMSLYYRAMGARVGRNCNIGTAICAAFDLISLGDNSSIGAETHILGYKVENGWLMLGPVSIGTNCYVGTHCTLGLDVRMDDQACLDDLSVLADHDIMRAGETRRGSPAENTGKAPPALARQHGRLLNGLFGLIHLLLIYVMGYLLILSASPAIGIVGLALYIGGPLAGFASALATAPLTILWYLTIVQTVKHLFIGRIKPAKYSTRSVTFLRYWFLRYLMTNTRHLMLPLYATLFFPHFLRSLGAKIGRNVEISTITQATPDLLEIGDESFLADACILGGHKIYGGQIDLRANRVGRRTFVGIAR